MCLKSSNYSFGDLRLILIDQVTLYPQCREGGAGEFDFIDDTDDNLLSMTLHEQSSVLCIADYY